MSVNVVMLALLEIPLIGYTLAPETTAERVKRFSAWLGSNGGRIALVLAVLIGLALVGRGIGSLV